MGSNHMNEQFGKRNSKAKKDSAKIVTTEVPFIAPIKNEIPMYDPQTGEPNPLYEELTGKKNPLAELRKNQFVTEHKSYEPKKKNRWLVHFPEHFNIEPWCVSKTQRPSINIVEKKFLGMIMSASAEWEKISFEFIDPINPSISKSLYALMEAELTETFDYTLEMLDPTGTVIETWIIKDCEIEYINLGSLEYSDDSIANCFMMIKPGKVILSK